MIQLENELAKIATYKNIVSTYFSSLLCTIKSHISVWLNFRQIEVV